MLSWSSRPSEIANLLNPAFCGFLTYKAIESYNSEAGHGMPYPLVFLLLPIILHTETRTKLPKATSTTILAWLNAHPEVTIEFPQRVQSPVCHTSLRENPVRKVL